MIHLYSGDGKGKTSIAVGMSVRMAGAGKEVLFAQFMKGNESSEIKILETLPNTTVLRVKEKFGFFEELTEKEKEKIASYHNEILEAVFKKIETYRIKEYKSTSKEPEILIVLDEITYPCMWNLINEKRLKEILKELPSQVELVMTGREPTDYMIEVCDYWSEVGMKKHSFEQNIIARHGVEY